MTTYTATTAIAKIKAETTVFLGQVVRKHNYPIEIRHELQKMASINEITPSEYYRALKITWDKMSDAEKASEEHEVATL